MNHDNERKAFEEHYIANYHDGDIHPHKKLLEWCEDSESYINSTIDNLWDMWLASTNREGYKLVPLEATQEMVDAVYNSTLASDDLEGIYKAMIGACDE
jgi:hypothetical protein